MVPPANLPNDTSTWTIAPTIAWVAEGEGRIALVNLSPETDWLPYIIGAPASSLWHALAVSGRTRNELIDMAHGIGVREGVALVDAFVRDLYGLGVLAEDVSV